MNAVLLICFGFSNL